MLDWGKALAMNTVRVLVFACLGTAWAQTAPSPAPQPTMPNLPDDTVVAIWDDGVKFTMADFKRLYYILPQQNQQLALRDRKTFLQQFGFMRKLAQMAEKEKLDQQSPSKETLDYYRLMILSQAELNVASMAPTVEPAEIVAFYDANKERYKQVKVKAIYLAFSSEPATGAKKGLTEKEAEAKANKLLADIRGGADFVKLVKENSDDETSRDKNGDFATFVPSDNIPDAIKTVVFALKQGETGGPVRQANGFYLLKAEEASYRPMSEVRDEIFTEIKNSRYAKWLEQKSKESTPQLPSPEFLGAPGAAK
jgi:peptidyl-prolyl cis-trans isomerase C